MGITPNEFKGTDSERIAQALAVLKTQGGGTLRIPQREDADGRAFWLIDEAILLDADTTLIIENCKPIVCDTDVKTTNGVGKGEVELLCISRV